MLHSWKHLSCLYPYFSQDVVWVATVQILSLTNQLPMLSMISLPKQTKHSQRNLTGLLHSWLYSNEKTVTLHFRCNYTKSICTVCVRNRRNYRGKHLLQRSGADQWHCSDVQMSCTVWLPCINYINDVLLRWGRGDLNWRRIHWNPPVWGNWLSMTF